MYLICDIYSIFMWWVKLYWMLLIILLSKPPHSLYFSCDINSLNSSGQSALDIAVFWNHKAAASLLSLHQQEEQFDQLHNYYSLNPLYRASDVRKDTEALESAKRNSSTKYIIFSNLQPFLLPSESPKKKYKWVYIICCLACIVE